MDILISTPVIKDYRKHFPYHYDLSAYPCGEELKTAIAEAEGRARVRTIKSLDVICSLDHIERELSIPKKAMEGIKVRVNVRHRNFAKAYTFTPYATIFCAEFCKGAWHVTEIYRGNCTKHFCEIEHTDASLAALINRFSTID